MNKANKIALLVLGSMLLTNPLSAQYIIRAIDWAVPHSPYISLVGGAYLCGLLLYNLRSEKLNIPSKETKTKPQKYVKT